MQNHRNYVCYYRVSTSKQGESGLGLEAQRETVRQYLNGGKWKIVAEVTEVETGTRKRARPKLIEALATCRLHGARLVVANVSRLTRDTRFLTTLADADVEVEFCDLPNVQGAVGKFVLQMMVSVAELEAGLISDRTKKALAAAKVRGVKLGGNRGKLDAAGIVGREVSTAVRQAKAKRHAADLTSIIEAIRAEGVVSLQGIARALTERGIPTARGGSTWQAGQVQRVMARLP